MGRSVNISTEIPPPLSMIDRLDLSKARKEHLGAAIQQSFVRFANEKDTAEPVFELDIMHDPLQELDLTDPVADFLTRLRNAHHAKHKKLDSPAFKWKFDVARILLEAGYIENYKPAEENGVKMIRVSLKYGPNNEPVIREFERISRPGNRVYLGKDKMTRVQDELGIAIVKTPRGLMTEHQAVSEGIFGEILCKIR
jgi:small subunit ribosomal protein S8